jgi:hypothetical protein
MRQRAEAEIGGTITRSGPLISNMCRKFACETHTTIILRAPSQ